MTQPTIVCFAFDIEEQKAIPKIFLRSLLYSTSKRGVVVENMFVKICLGGSTQTFSVWAYGEKKLVRGSGIYVGPEGVAHNHHFLLPSDGSKFEFISGDYQIEIFARLVGRKRTLKLAEINLVLTDEQAKGMQSGDTAIMFDGGQIHNDTYHFYAIRHEYQQTRN